MVNFFISPLRAEGATTIAIAIIRRAIALKREQSKAINKAKEDKDH